MSEKQEATIDEAMVKEIPNGEVVKPAAVIEKKKKRGKATARAIFILCIIGSITATLRDFYQYEIGITMIYIGWALYVFKFKWHGLALQNFGFTMAFLYPRQASSGTSGPAHRRYG